MKKAKTLFTLIVIIISSSLGQAETTLGPNLLINHNFSTPSLPQGVSYHLFNNSILGWNCTTFCQIASCYQYNAWVQTWNANLFFGDCPQQAIDTSSNSIDVVSQYFEAQAGEHTLDLKFVLPVMYANLKTLVVMINQKIIYRFHPLFGDFYHKEASISISLNSGLNKISITSEGKDDVSGFRIFDVKIRRVIHSQINRVIDMAINNQMLTNLVSIPCSRILFGQIVNTLISFDRMQLYYYHHRNYSYYYSIFLKGITDLLNQKGEYATYISDAFLSSIGTSEQSILNSINYKAGRKYKDGQQKNIFLENGGFFFIISSFPLALFIYLCLNCLFRLTFHEKFSKFIRKYSFYSIVLLMLFEGNIQQFSFLIMDEFLEYFSACFSHKMVNIGILIIFYLIVFCSTAFYLYCWHIHHKKMSNFTENVTIQIGGMIAYTFDRGFICLILGSTHRLTLLLGQKQLFILVILQLLLIIPKIIFILYSSYKCKKLGWMSVLQGLTRICFQISIFMYQDSGDQSGFINEQIHLRIIYVFLFIWTLSFTFSLIEMLKQLVSQKYPKSKLQSIHLANMINSSSKKNHSILRYQNQFGTYKQKDKGLRIRIMGKMKKVTIRRTQST